MSASQRWLSGVHGWTDATPLQVSVFLCAAAGLVLAQPTRLSLIVGAAVGLAGLILMAAVEYVPPPSYDVKRRDLRIQGAFRFLRHPRLSALFLECLAVSLASRSFLAALILLSVVTLAIRAEGRRRDHGLNALAPLPFLRYRERVDAFFPTLMPLDPNVTTGAGVRRIAHQMLHAAVRTILRQWLLIAVFLCLYAQFMISQPPWIIGAGVVAAFAVFRVAYVRSAKHSNRK